jgi:hypothetical protein
MELRQQATDHLNDDIDMRGASLPYAACSRVKREHFSAMKNV